MKEYSNNIERYIMLRTATRVPNSELGNKDVAEAYLDKYWMPKEEVNSIWLPILRTVFANALEASLPRLEIGSAFQILPRYGGFMVPDKEYFERLMRCLAQVGETDFVIVQDFRADPPPGDPAPFSLKYPVSTTWEELKSGDYISAVLFDWPATDYFIFGKSGIWAIYVATDFYPSIEIIAFTDPAAKIFRSAFTPKPEVLEELIEKVLPEKYKKYL